ncbi:phage tail tape measure protein [Streptomyces sp. VTCC 41912]|uniref:phage tail tape measure protein n=1 Tax=Streptomyces sp. VTCC 41912 TaxID=3383243 RepID=UPI003896B04B
MADVADLFVVLRAETAPFTAGMRTAAAEGESFTAKMGGVGGVMTKLGAATTVAGIGIATVSVKMAGDFQASMQKLVTTAGESQANLKRVSSGILDIAVQTGTSTKALADGMYMVESAGFHGAQGLTVLKAAAEGARAEQAPLPEVTNAVTSALNSYHLPASAAVQITNQMVAAVGHGKMTFGEFAGSLSTVLPIASSAHLSFAQVGGAIATLTNHGTSAREATQELAFSIRALQAPNNVAVQEMQRLGLSSVDVSTHLGQRGLTGTISMLQQAVLQHMGSAGTVLLNAFNTSKQAAEDANVMISKMPASLQKLAQSYAQGGISVADWKKQIKALPVDQANLLTQFATLTNKSKGFNSQLKAGGPAAQTYNDAMKKMMGGATGLNTALMLGGESMSQFRSNVAAVGAAGQHAGKDIHGWAATQQTFNFQISQLKERVQVAAITIGTKLIPVVSAVIGFFTKYQGVTIALAAVIGGVLTAAVIRFATGAVSGAIKGVSEIGSGLRTAGTAIRAFATSEKVAAAASKIMAAAQWLLNAAMDANPIGLIVIAIAALVAGLIYAYNHSARFRAIVQAAFEGVKVAAVAVWHALQAAWNGLVAGVKWLWNAIKGAWDGISSVTSTVWNAIVGFFKKWWPLLLAIFAPPIALVISIWNHCHNTIINVAKTVWNAITSFLSSIWNGIKDAAATLWLGIQITIINPIKRVWSTLVSIWNFVMDWLESQWLSIKRTAALIWLGIQMSIINPIRSAWHTLTSIISSIGSSIWNGLVSAWNSVKSVGSWFLSIGTNIVNGIINGVENAAGYLYNSLKNLASNALNAAKNFLGISSPSREFADQIGQWIPHGIAVGITQHAQVATDAADALAQRTLGTAKTALVTPTAGGALVAGGGAVPGGQTVTVNITVQGSVLSERDLRDVVQTQMLRLGMRSSTSYTPYKR